MKIEFTKKGVSVPGIEHKARRAVKVLLTHEHVHARQTIHVIWTTREELRALNRRFRGTNRFTDVIAFRYDGEDHPAPFGDIFIAVPQARLNARRFHVPLAQELLRLVVHGGLHLLGYTDYTPRARKKMWDIQEKIVAGSR